MKVVSTNPSTGETVTLGVDESTPEQVTEAARLAQWDAAAYAEKPLSWRSELLRRMGDELDADADTLVATAMRETALPEARLRGELARTSFQLRFFADVISDGAFLQASIDHPTDSPMGPLPDLRRIHNPVGPVAVFGSSNFPFAFSVPGGDTASALAAGCPVLIKAHPAHPATSLATFEALERAARLHGAPRHTLSLFFGFEAGTALVNAPSVAAVGFTGSLVAGQALWTAANARPTPIPFFGELGSANPLVVTEQAARERAGEIGAGAAASVTLGAGQFCTKPGLIFVPAGSTGDELVTSMVGALENLDEFTMLSQTIAENFARGVSRFAHDAGDALVSGATTKGTGARAHLLEVDAEGFIANPALHEECFGPVAILVRYATRDELRLALETAEPALTFTVHCGDDDVDAAWLVEFGAERAGRIVLNGFPTGVGVSWSMQHGGPWPSTTAPWATSVGARAIDRWLRPVAYQSVPDHLLPPGLQDANPLSIVRRIDGTLVVPG